MGVGGIGTDGVDKKNIRKMQVKEIYSLNYRGLRNNSKDHELPPISIPPFSLSKEISILCKAAMHRTKRICFPASLASGMTI